LGFHATTASLYSLCQEPETMQHYIIDCQWQQEL